MPDAEYLVSFGSAGDFSRFRPDPPAVYHRGDKVVVRTHQGLELGEVLCRATPDHDRFLSAAGAGELLRHLTPEDEHAVERARQRSQQIFDHARRLAAELTLPLEILDVEVLLDGRHVVIEHLSPPHCDYRPLVSTLARTHDVQVVMQNQALSEGLGADDPGCGKPGCGQAAGGCTSCGKGGCTTGGCATGCGVATRPETVAAYLAGLRQHTESRSPLPVL
jgi:hypothetical protein